jgi:hypothetical protein
MNMSSVKPIPQNLVYPGIENSLRLQHAHLVVTEHEIPQLPRRPLIPNPIVLELKRGQLPGIRPKFTPHRRQVQTLQKDLTTISNRSLQVGPLPMIQRSIPVMHPPVQQVILLLVRMIRPPLILLQVTRQFIIQQPVQVMHPPLILPRAIHRRSTTRVDPQKHLLVTLLELTAQPQYQDTLHTAPPQALQVMRTKEITLSLTIWNTAPILKTHSAHFLPFSFLLPTTYLVVVTQSLKKNFVEFSYGPRSLNQKMEILQTIRIHRGRDHQQQKNSLLW